MSDSTSTKKVVINSILYSFSGILLKCFSFFLLPLYTAYLTTEDYGISTLATSFVGTMTFIVSMSLYSAIMRFFVDLKDNPNQLKRFYGTVTVFTCISGIIWLIIITVLHDVVSERIFSGVDYYPIIVVCVLGLLFTCQTTIYDDILKSQQKALKSSVLTIITFLVSLLLNIVFIVGLKMGALGLLLSTLITQVLFTIYFWADMIRHKQIEFCLDMSLLKDALKYSIPIIPHNLATKLALLISKVLIGDVVSLASVGIYGVATQFGDIADTLQSYVDKAYQPWLYETLNKRDESYKNTIRSTVKMLISVLGLLFIGIALLSQDYIVLFVNESYIDSWKYIPLIVLVFAIKTIYYFYVEVLFYHKSASRLVFIATLSSSFVNIIMSYLFIPRYGIIGSILADAIAMFIRVTIVVSISKKYENIGLRVSDFIINFLVIAIFIGLGLLPSILHDQDGFNFLYFIFKLVVIGLYIFILFIKYRNQLSMFISLVKRKQ